MKKLILSIAVLILTILSVSAQTRHKALLIIDIQDFYFPGGKSALVESEKAAANAALLLDNFRKEKLIVIHVSHISEPGGKIVEAATRAASDYGFKCILIHDACATKDLKFGEKIIKAEDVHYSTLSTLKNYAEVESTNEYLKR